MTNFLTNEPWKTLVPECYEWVLSVDIEKVAGPRENLPMVVPFKAGKDGAWEVLGLGLSKEFLKRVQDITRALGWKASARGALSVLVEETPVTLVGISDLKVTPAQIARQWGMDAVKAMKDSAPKKFILCAGRGLDERSVWDGVFAAYYKAPTFKTRDNGAKPSSLPTWIGVLGGTLTAKERDDRRAFARAQTLARMVQDAPGNWLTPKKFAEIAKDVAREVGLKCKILGRSEMEKLGMGAFLGVASGSDQEPQLIVLEYVGKIKERVALVGKGLTFDSGGISLKTAAGMGEMKYDMSGGAAVLGTMMYLAGARPRCGVVGLIGAAENMPSGKSIRPGDILKTMSGKTITVDNTDAEGRLVLSDVLHYAVKEYKPAMMIDIATLTGAVVMALGKAGAAVMSNDQKTADYLLRQAREVGEPFWQMPLWPELEKEVRAEASDLINVAKPSVKAGSLTAAVFLKHFVGETPWAHLDIAGTSDACAALGYPASGGSAFGMRTMVECCARWGAK
jgi:leucyl aminopeptidase